MCNVEHKSEYILLELNRSFERYKNVSLRREAILKVEKDSSTHLALINNYLVAKYKINEPLTAKILCEAQIKTLLAEIKAKECHERLFKKRNHELDDVKDSAIWLAKGNKSQKTKVLIASFKIGIFSLVKRHNAHTAEQQLKQWTT